MTEEQILIKWKAEDMAKAVVLDVLLDNKDFQKSAPELYQELKQMTEEMILKTYPESEILS